MYAAFKTPFARVRTYFWANKILHGSAFRWIRISSIIRYGSTFTRIPVNTWTVQVRGLVPSYVPFCWTGKKFVRIHIITGSSKNSERPGTRNIEQNLSVLCVKHSICELATVSHGRATSLQGPVFLADSPYVDCCFNLSTAATSLQWQLSSVPRVAVVERFNYMFKLELSWQSEDSAVSGTLYYGKNLLKV